MLSIEARDKEKLAKEDRMEANLGIQADVTQANNGRDLASDERQTGKKPGGVSDAEFALMAKDMNDMRSQMQGMKGDEPKDKPVTTANGKLVMGGLAQIWYDKPGQGNGAQPGQDQSDKREYKSAELQSDRPIVGQSVLSADGVAAESAKQPTAGVPTSPLDVDYVFDDNGRRDPFTNTRNITVLPAPDAVAAAEKSDKKTADQGAITFGNNGITAEGYAKGNATTPYTGATTVDAGIEIKRTTRVDVDTMMDNKFGPSAPVTSSGAASVNGVAGTLQGNNSFGYRPDHSADVSNVVTLADKSPEAGKPAGGPKPVPDPLSQPSRFGLFAVGGGPGISTPPPEHYGSYIVPKHDEQTSGQTAGALPATGLPSAFPEVPNTLTLGEGAASNAPGNKADESKAEAGFRKQWYSDALGSPVLVQGLTSNMLPNNPPGAAVAQDSNSSARGRTEGLNDAIKVAPGGEPNLAFKQERADRLNIPHSDYLIYPDDWKQIAERTSKESPKAGAKPDASAATAHYWADTQARAGDVRTEGVALGQPGISGNDATLKWESAFPTGVANGIAPATGTIVPSLDIFSLNDAVDKKGGAVADPKLALGTMGLGANANDDAPMKKLGKDSGFAYERQSDRDFDLQINVANGREAGKKSLPPVTSDNDKDKVCVNPLNATDEKIPAVYKDEPYQVQINKDKPGEAPVYETRTRKVCVTPAQTTKETIPSLKKEEGELESVYAPPTVEGYSGWKRSAEPAKPSGEVTEGKQEAAKQSNVQLDRRRKESERTLNLAVDQARIALETGRFDVAREQAEKALELDPGNPDATSVRVQSRDKQYAARAKQIADEAASFQNREGGSNSTKKSIAKDTELFKIRLGKMLENAKALYDQHDYKGAEQMALRVQNNDPLNKEAESWKNKARAASHAGEHKEFAENYHEEYRNQMLDNYEASISTAPLIKYPDNWDQISQRSDVHRDLSRLLESDENAVAPTPKLPSQISRNLILPENDPLVNGGDPEARNYDPFQIMRQQRMGRNAGVQTPETAAELPRKIDDANYKQALKEQLQQYNIRDLTVAVTDFPGPRIDVGTAGEGKPGGDPFHSPSGKKLADVDLATLIKDKLMPNEFADPQFTIDVSNGKLVVFQTPENQAKIRQILESLRELKKEQASQLPFPGFVNGAGGTFSQVGSIADPELRNSFSGGSPEFERLPAITSRGPRPILLLHPRLDPNFPHRGRFARRGRNLLARVSFAARRKSQADAGRILPPSRRGASRSDHR